MREIPVPTALQQLARIFSDAGHVLYAVGGLPRNGLLGLPYSDMDVCSAVPPEQVLALCRENNITCIEKALKFGTVEIHYSGAAFEHTTFRGAEQYAAGGAHRPISVQIGATLTEDAFRRDFTVNALYLNLQTGELLDPTGGIADLTNNILRATSPDPHTILQDDGLRVLRLVRFAVQLGLTIEPATLAAAKDCAHLLQDIAWERKRDELVKILMADVRYPTRPKPESPVLTGLRLLEHIGCWPYLVPELLEGQGIHQRPRHHAYTVLEHGYHTAACIPAQELLRVAALLHDVGKPAALREKELPEDAGATDTPKTPHPMLGHDRIGADMAAQILDRLRFPKAFIEDAVFLISHHMFDLNENAKEGTLRMRFAAWGKRRVEMLIALREADFVGSGILPAHTAIRWRQALSDMERESAPFSLAALAVNGEDVMRVKNIGPGPEVGKYLTLLLRHCARVPKDNSKERLETILRGL